MNSKLEIKSDEVRLEDGLIAANVQQLRIAMDRVEHLTDRVAGLGDRLMGVLPSIAEDDIDPRGISGGSIDEISYCITHVLGSLEQLDLKLSRLEDL